MPVTSDKKLAQISRANRIRDAIKRDIAPLPNCKNPDRRLATRYDLKKFAQTYFPKIAFRFDTLQDKLYSRIQDSILQSRDAVIAIPRGSAKTSTSLIAAWWALLHRHRRFLFFGVFGTERAAQMTNSFLAATANNPRLAADFPEQIIPIAVHRLYRSSRQSYNGVLTDIKVGSSVVQSAGFESVRPWRAEFHSVHSAVRGVNATLNDGSVIRPDLIILDDPQTDATAVKPERTAGILEVINKSIIPLTHGTKTANIIVCGTVIEPNDVMDTLLHSERFPNAFTERAVLAMPQNLEYWQKWYEEYTVNGRIAGAEYYAQNSEKMLEGAIWNEVSFDTKRFENCLQALIFEYIATPEAFFSERQNSPIDRMEALFHTGVIAGNKIDYVEEEERLPIYIGLDVHDDILYWTAVKNTDEKIAFVLDAGVYPKQELMPAKGQMLSYRLNPKFKSLPLEMQLEAALNELLDYLDKRFKPKIILLDGRYQADTIKKIAEVRKNVYRTLGVTTQTAAGVGQFKKRAGDELGTNWIIKRVYGLKKHTVYTDTAEMKGILSSIGYYYSNLPEHVLLSYRRAEVGELIETTTGKKWKFKETKLAENHFLDSLVYAFTAMRIDDESKIINGSAKQRIAKMNAAINK